MAVDRTKVLAAAQKHLSKGQYDRAIAEYRKLVEADPRDVRTWLKIGDLYTRKGSHREATETYQRVADHYATQGFFLKAVAVYKQILKLQPQRLDVQLKLAEMYENLQLVSDALQTYEQVAQAYMKAGEVERALSTLGRMAELDPDNIPVRIRYAEGLSKAGRTDEAANEFEAGAELLREQGRMDDYLKVAERLLYHRPADVALARELAELYLQRNDAKRALAKLQLCFKQNPKDVGTLELLARAFHVLGQTPKTVSVYREMARIHQEANRPEERARILKKILELDPQDAEARQALASFAPKKTKAAPPPVMDDDEPELELLEPDSAEIMIVDDDDDLDAYVDDGMTQMSPEGEVFDEASLDDLEVDIGSVVDVLPTEDDDEPELLIAEPADPGADDPDTRDADLDEMEARPSIPPDVAREAQIARLLTECDVFERYGLHAKVVGQLEQVLQLAPEHVEARERLKEVYLKLGRTEDAAQQLVALAEFAESPAVAHLYLTQAAELDPRLSVPPDPADLYDDPLPPTGEVPTTDLEAAPEPTVPLDEEDDDILFVDDDMTEMQPSILEGSSVDEALAAAVDAQPDPAPPTPVPPSDPGPLHTVVSASPLELDMDDATSMEVVAPPERAALEPAPPVDPVQLDPVQLDPVQPDPVPVDPARLAPMSPEAFEAAPLATDNDPVQEAQDRASIPPGEIEETLDEADFFLAQGLFEAARATIEDALDTHPGHLLLQDKLVEIAELQTHAASMVPPPAAPAATSEGDEAFALAEKLAEELGDEDVEELPGADVLDVENVFEQFKKGVEEQIGLEDTDTHFDLGIAYKEMGLLDDAVGEFQLAMKNPSRECICHTMIGLCRIEQGRVTDGIAEFKKGLYADHKTDREELGLYFELGSAYEQLEDTREALYYYQKVAKRDETFRDVQERIARLTDPGAAPAPDALVLDDDLDAAFDDLMGDD